MQEPTKSSEPGGRFRIRGIFYFAAMLLAVLAVASYTPEDAAAITGGIATPPPNWIGRLGAFFAYGLFLICGLGAYVLLTLLLLRLIRLCFPRPGTASVFIAGTLLVLWGALLLLGLAPEPFIGITEKLGLGHAQTPQSALSGGVIGQLLAAPGTEAVGEGVLRQLIGAVGTMIFGWALMTGGAVMIYIGDWHNLLRDFVFTGRWEGAPAENIRSSRRMKRLSEAEAEAEAGMTTEEQERPAPVPVQEELPEREAAPEERGRSRLAPLAALFSKKETAPPEDPESDDSVPWDDDDEEGTPTPSPAEDAAEKPFFPPPPPRASASLRRGDEVDTTVAAPGSRVRAAGGSEEYVLPPVSMLSQGADVGGEDIDAIATAKESLQRTLEDFGIPGHVAGYTSGPRVTRFEIMLDPGVNVKKVEQIADNIAMNLSAQSVRILAPIPGRPVVGVEVSNRSSEAVFMRSVMESEAWRSGKSEIPVALGKDVAGKPVVLDIAKAPHMLIAGSTGTGKSVCSNTLIMSLLFRFKPEELKLIMVDPKVVEFEDYKRLPHLLTPVINDSGKVPIALRWAVNEMEKRYRILARAGVKKISEFNSRPLGGEELTDEDGRPIPERMPVLIAIIDELGDLMMTEAKKDVENSITRIAQKGRAAGVHIVVATQRPSTNVITGVIKANLPTRLCFQVRSLVDSRVVLDSGGAEKLLGKGDMLYMCPSSMNIERVQGSFVPDPDIKKVVDFVCSQAPQQFNSQVLAEESVGDGDDDAPDETMEEFDSQDQADIAGIVKRYLRPGDDETVKQALEVVILDRKVSTSYLQRRLKIGYNRSAEVIELLEERGVVGPPSGSGNKREILIFDGLEVNE